MQGKLPGLNVLFHATLLDEPFSQLRAFAHGYHPAGDVAAENIQDHVEIEDRSFEAEARAVYTYPSMGNGIAFVSMTLENRETLERWIESLAH